MKKKSKKKEPLTIPNLIRNGYFQWLIGVIIFSGGVYCILNAIVNTLDILTSQNYAIYQIVSALMIERM